MPFPHEVASAEEAYENVRQVEWNEGERRIRG